MKNGNFSKKILVTSISAMMLLAIAPLMSNASAVTTLELCIAIDRSGSIVQSDLDIIKTGIKTAFMDASVIAGSVSQMAKISVVSFASGTTLEIAPMTMVDASDVSDLADAIGALPLLSGGATDTAGALDLCAQQFDDPTIAIIDIVTDGVPSDESAAQTSANNANAAGITVNALAIGNIDQDVLDDLVDGPPVGTVFLTPNVAGFDTAFMKKIMFEFNIPVGGTLFPIDTTALFVSGFMLNSVWLIPTVAATGISGAGLYLARDRFSKKSDNK